MEKPTGDSHPPPAKRIPNSCGPAAIASFHSDPPPFLDWLQCAEGIRQPPVPRARRAGDAVAVGVGLAVAELSRLRRHRVGERGDAVADRAASHQLGVDDDLDAVVDARVALVEVEAVKLRLGDEVEDALDAATARTLDVRVEPLDEPPPAKRGAAYGPRLGYAAAYLLGVQVRPVGEVQEGVGACGEAPLESLPVLNRVFAFS